MQTGRGGIGLVAAHPDDPVGDALLRQSEIRQRLEESQRRFEARETRTIPHEESDVVWARRASVFGAAVRRGVKLTWQPAALSDLEAAAECSPRHAKAVIDAMERMAQPDVPTGQSRLCGVFYRVARGELAVIGIVDARRLRWLPGRDPQA
jgi:hypothetical protein